MSETQVRGCFEGFRARGGTGEVRAASFTCNKEEYGKRINLGQSNIKYLIFLVFSKLSNLTLSAKNYAKTAMLEHCEVLLFVFFCFVQPRQSRAFLNGIQCFKNGQYTFFARKLPCVEAFDAVFFCVLCFFFLTKLKKPRLELLNDQ